MKYLGIVIMCVSIILFIGSLFSLKETQFGYTSMTFEHSMMMLLIGYMIYTMHQDEEVKQ